MTAATQPATASRIRWPLLLVLASLAAVAPVATDLYLPGFPAMGDELGADASGVQLTLTSFLIGLAFGQLVMGPLADRFGRRRPLVISTAVCVLAGIVCALAPTLPVLVGGLLCLAMLVGVIAVVAETRPPAAAGETPASWPGALRVVARSRGYWAPVAVFALSFGVMMAYIAASPFLYQNVVGLSAIGYGIMFGVNAAGLITAALAMARVRPVAGTGSAVLGFSQFALGAVVSPLVGLGGAHSAVVPAAVMAAASLSAFVASRLMRH